MLAALALPLPAAIRAQPGQRQGDAVRRDRGHRRARGPRAKRRLAARHVVPHVPCRARMIALGFRIANAGPTIEADHVRLEVLR
jgi:hypothetical protein